MKQCKQLTLKQKLDVLDDIKKGVERKELASKYGCSVSTISRICKKEEILINSRLLNKNCEKKRLREGKYKEVDNALKIWLDQLRVSNGPISGPIVMEQAKKFAVKLNLDFEPSNGWLDRWKKRNNIVFKPSQGEKVLDDIESANAFHMSLPACIEKYGEKNIFTAGETALFYRALPNETFTVKEEIDAKEEKDRVTLLLVANMDGSEKYSYVIGRVKQPRCFNDKNVSMPYFSNAKAWMISQTWTKIWMEFNAKLTPQRRKIVLFIDNAPCHKLSDGVLLENIEMVFFPTLLIQPLDVGVIKCFKAYYRQQLVRKQMLALERGQKFKDFAKSIEMLLAIRMIERAWCLVPPSTIQHCFRKCGFKSGEHERLVEEEEAKIFVLPITGEEFEEYVDIDRHLKCSGNLNCDEILDEVRLQDDETVVEEPKDENAIKRHVTRTEALQSLENLRHYLESQDECTEKLDFIETQLLKLNTNYHQMKTSDFFQ